MKVTVESCWSGGERFSFRLTIPNGARPGVSARESVRGDRWTRKTATEALDLIEALYHVDRRSIRFVHK